MDRSPVPFFTAQERDFLGCDHRFYFKQLEFCDNLIFRERAVLDALHDRLLDSNRKLGSPDQVAVIFGHRITGGTMAGSKPLWRTFTWANQSCGPCTNTAF
jgi:hypothetical protein